MEKDNDDKPAYKRFLELSQREKKGSKFSFSLDSETSSSFFTHKELQQKASNINRAKKYLQFLVYEFDRDNKDPEYKLIQFDVLKDHYSQFIKYSTLNNQDGECLDDNKAQEFKIKIQDRGTMAYFESALFYKIKAEQRFSKINSIPESDRTKKMERAISAAKRALQDFNQSYMIDNANKESLRFKKETKAFITNLENIVRDSVPYRKSIDITKEAYAINVKADKKIVSARRMKTKFEKDSKKDLEQETVPQTRKRSSSIEALKRFLINPIAKQEKRRSLPSIEKSQFLSTIHETKEKCLQELESAEFLCLKAIEIYLKAYSEYSAPLLFDRIQSIWRRVEMLEDERVQLSPHGFTVISKVGEIKAKIEEITHQLELEARTVDSSSSE